MKRLLLLVVLALVAFTASCGNNDDPAVASGDASNGVGEHGDADVAFARQMIPHHEEAIEMAQVALEKSETPDVTDLAGRIVDAQEPEIKKMQGWLKDWDETLSNAESGSTTASGMPTDSSSAAGRMMSGGEMSDLKIAKGGAFDRMFLEMMKEHHRTAISMAATELKQGQSPEAKSLAQDIVDSQEKEIAEMEALLVRVTGSSTTTP